MSEPLGGLFIAALLIAALTAVLVTPLVRRLALHVGMLDKSDERRMPTEPKPRIGGLAIFLGFSFALFTTVGFAIQATKLFHRTDDIHQFFGLLFGGTLILMVGVWDDVMGMSSRSKLLAQIVVAGVSMLYGFVIHGFDIGFFGAYVSLPEWAALLLTLVWYLGMMNAINFLDGLDGLLTGVTAISGLFLFAISLGHGNLVAALVLSSLVGAALGFLPYNFNPAKIILGDTGSLFIGYIFATVSVMTTSKTAIAVGLLVPLVALALPVVDTAFAILRRARAGKRITEADRGHFHHVLVFKFGLNVRQAVLLIYVLTFALGAAAYVLSGGLSGHVRVAGVL
jgi:UDP-GlcNAc:undecaprenyl-phosphate GlcNAc-1-phosphate transferase